MSMSKSYDCVWDALEDDPAVAADFRARSDLMMDLTAYVKSNDLSVVDAANKLQVSEDEITQLFEGAISEFSQDKLKLMKSLLSD